MRKRFALGLLALAAWSGSVAFAQSAAPQILPVPPSNGFAAFVGEPFSQVFTCPACPTNTVLTLSPQLPLPNGLAFGTSAATLAGVPTTPNQASAFTIIATANNQQITFRSYQIVTDRRLSFLTPIALPPATAGVNLTRTIQVNLSSVWDNGSSTLPAGVNLQLTSGSSTTISIAGTFPLVSTPTTYSVQVFASYPPNQLSVPSISQNINRTFTILVNPRPTLGGNIPAGQIGIPYSAGLLASGGTAPYTYSVNGNLPPGIALNASTGVFTGTPMLNGTFPFQVTLTDANGATSFATFSISVTGTPMQITSLTFPAGRVAQNYSAPLTVIGGTAPYTWTILPGTLPPPGIGISGATLAGIPNSIGLFPFTLRVQDSSGLSAQANVSLAVSPGLLTISNTALPNATPGAPYQATLAATGGIAPYAWVLSSGTLPNGITLAANGLLSGTPTTASVATFSVRVTDTPNGQVGYTGGAATRDFTITVGAGALTISPITLPASVVGQPFTPTLTATGGTPPYVWSVSSGSTPAGVTLGSTGTFSGTPTAAGPSNFTVQVRDSAGATASRDFSVNTIAGLNITPTTLDDGVVGTPYNFTLGAQNGTAPYVFSLAGGALPAGLSLSSTGILTGTPTPNSAGTASFTVRAVDRGNLTAQRDFTLRIRPILTLITDSLPGGSVGAPYNVQVNADGGFPPYTFALATGTLPAGLALSTTGAITGTPTVAGMAGISIRVTDSRGVMATRGFTLVIGQVSLPTVTVTQITDTTMAASQPAFGISLSSAFPSAIDGTVTLAFQPESGPADPDVRFANGSNSLNFAIPAGQTNAVPPAGTPFAFASGTTAGTITLTVVLRSNGQVLNPNPAAVRTIRLNRAGPTITNVRINRTATGFEVLVTGYSNTREISGGNLRFNPAPGVTLSAAEFPLNVGAAFQTWFASAPSANFGTQFLLTIPFTVADGTAASLSTVLVTLTNGAGSGSALGNF